MRSIVCRQIRGEVRLILDGQEVAALPFGAALELAAALRTVAAGKGEGWLYAEGRLKVGQARGRVVVLYAGKPLLDVPAEAAGTIAAAIRQAAKLAEHWSILHHTASRQRLYDDQEKLIRGGLNVCNLGVPEPELRAMGGISLGRRGRVGMPGLVGHSPLTTHHSPPRGRINGSS